MKNGPMSLPPSLNVKNTFINVQSMPVADDEDVNAEEDFGESFHKRQFSEPAPSIMRQLSATRQSSSPYVDQHAPKAMLGPSTLAEEDEEFEENEEPETEKEPAIFAPPTAPRQDTDFGSEQDFRGLHGRQVTELQWPSWGQNSDPLPMPMFPLDPAVFLKVMAGQPQNLPEPYTQTMPRSTGQLAMPSRWEDNAKDMKPERTAMDGRRMSQGLVPGLGVLGMVDPACVDVPPDWQSKTTVMLRNMPNKYNQQMLLEELNSSGFQDTYDFLHLPIDPETNANRGYCFINFKEPAYAWQLKKTYEGRKMGRFNSEKVVSVAPAALQGFEANYAHYSNARVNRGDLSTRPLFLRESEVCPAKHDAGRRRGGRRSRGSLVDMAARLQANQKQQAPVSGVTELSATYIGLQGATVNEPQDPGMVDSGSRKQGSGKNANKSQLQAPGPSGAASAEVGALRFCPFCGGQTQPGFRFCQFCGASLSFLAS